MGASQGIQESQIMWCKHCRQDTPGIRSAKLPGIRCGRCGTALGSEPADAQCDSAQEAAHPAEVGIDLGHASPAQASFEDWQLDQNLRFLETQLGPWKRDRSGARAESEALIGASTRPTPPVRRSPALQRRRHMDRPARRSNVLAHGVLWLGLSALAVGGGLFGWSLVEKRPELWKLGAPVAAAGVVVFLVGLAWQLERIWRNSRFAVQKLRQLDEQLQQLERTTSMLGVTQGSAAQAFYTHMAESASPHMLLADLKGQIDLLAMDLARRGS